MLNYTLFTPKKSYTFAKKLIFFARKFDQRIKSYKIPKNFNLFAKTFKQIMISDFVNYQLMLKWAVLIL